MLEGFLLAVTKHQGSSLHEEEATESRPETNNPSWTHQRKAKPNVLCYSFACEQSKTEAAVTTVTNQKQDLKGTFVLPSASKQCSGPCPGELAECCATAMGNSHHWRREGSARPGGQREFPSVTSVQLCHHLRGVPET